jgi:gas vesicle protein
MLKFMAGILCGVGAGLLIAPEPGEQTRRRLMRVVQEPEEIAREAVSNVREKAGDMGANLGREAAQRAVDRVVPEKFSPTRRRSG